MSSWRRVGAFLGLVPDGDPDDDGYQDGRADYQQAPYQETPDRQAPYEPGGYGPSSRPLRRRSRAAHVEGIHDGGSAPMVHGALAVQVQPDLPRPTEPGTASRPLTVKLTGFGEARVIGERYRDGASVILDMTDLTDNDARRVVDFAAGLAFAKRGSIDKVTSRVFMLLPPHADMSDVDRHAYAGSYQRR